MPIKFANSSGAIVDESATGPKFPIYFCEHCGFRGAAFHKKQGDRVLSYCGWKAGRPACISKGEGAAAHALDDASQTPQVFADSI